MILKTLTLSALTASVLFAAAPMALSSMSTDNGGTKKAIDAYSDGAGVLLINQVGDSKADNSVMNKLVFKFGDAAKAANSTLKTQVNLSTSGATDQEKAAASATLEFAKIAINPPISGDNCNDNNPQTINDVWVGSICAGTNVEGTSCDDKSVSTVGDKYVSGVCVGTAPVNLCRNGSLTGIGTGDVAWDAYWGGLNNGNRSDWGARTNTSGDAANVGRGNSLTFSTPKTIKHMILYGYRTEGFKGVVQYHNGSSWVTATSFDFNRVAYNGGEKISFNASGAIAATTWRWYITSAGSIITNYYLYEIEMYEEL